MARPDPDPDEPSHAHRFPANLDRAVLDAEEKHMIVDIIKEVSSRMSPHWRLNYRIRHHARQAVISYINDLRDADLRAYHEPTLLEQFNVGPHSSPHRSRSRSPQTENTTLSTNGEPQPFSHAEDRAIIHKDEEACISSSARGSHETLTAHELLSIRLTRTCLNRQHR